jgi:hypothetical protein
MSYVYFKHESFYEVSGLNMNVVIRDVKSGIAKYGNRARDTISYCGRFRQ